MLGFAAFALTWLSLRSSIFEAPRAGLFQRLAIARAKKMWGAGFVDQLVRCPFCVGTHFSWMLILVADGWLGPRQFFLDWMVVVGVTYTLVYAAEAVEYLWEE